MSIYDEKKRKSNHNDCDLDFGGHTDLYKSHSLCDNRTSIETMQVVSAYHLTVDTNGAQIDQSWLFEKDDLTYIDIAKTFEQTYFVTDYAGGSGDSGALNELTIAFGETMDGMPDIRITVSENGYIQINGKRAYPLSLKYAGKRLYVHLLGCLQDGADLQQ